MKKLLIIPLISLVSLVNAQGLGAPTQVEHFENESITKDVLAKVKEISGSACTATSATVNRSTQDNIWSFNLKCEGKVCEINVIEKQPLMWIEGPEDCIICCE